MCPRLLKHVVVTVTLGFSLIQVGCDDARPHLDYYVATWDNCWADYCRIPGDEMPRLSESDAAQIVTDENLATTEMRQPLRSLDHSPSLKFYVDIRSGKYWVRLDPAFRSDAPDTVLGPFQLPE
jgi:hypothetical protein